MMFKRLLLIIVVCAERSSCLTCYQCHIQGHGHGHELHLECSPELCTQGQVCVIQHSTHGAYKLVPKIPHGCQPESYCDGSKCCRDDDCVEKVMIAANIPLVANPHQLSTPPYVQPTTTHDIQSTTFHHVQSTATTTSPFKCHDEVVSLMNSCQALASSGACLGRLGVHVCKQTCGFCDYVKSTFGDEGYCRDTLINNECSSLSSHSSCADPLAIYVCPATCGLCEVKLQNVIDDFLNKTKSIPMSRSTTTPSTTTSTTSTTTTTTTPCIDTVTNNGCASIANICQDDIAYAVCPRFCNLCDGNLNITSTKKSMIGTFTQTKPFSSKHTTTIGEITTQEKKTTMSTTGPSKPTMSLRMIPFIATKVAFSKGSTTTPHQCVDQLQNNGCAMLPTNMCQESFAYTTCAKFCNLCGQI